MSPRAKTTTPPTPTEAPTVTPPTATAPAGSAHLALRRPRLPQWAPWLVAAVAAATSAILALLLGWSVVGWAVVAVLRVRRGAAVVVPGRGERPRREGPAGHHAGLVGVRGRPACRSSR